MSDEEDELQQIRAARAAREGIRARPLQDQSSAAYFIEPKQDSMMHGRAMQAPHEEEEEEQDMIRIKIRRHTVCKKYCAMILPVMKRNGNKKSEIQSYLVMILL